MKKIVLVLILLLLSSLTALDISYGKGSYKTEMSIKGLINPKFMEHDVDHDINVFVLSQPPIEFSRMPLFYYFDAQIHTSDNKKTTTYFANYMANVQMPFFGSINDNLDRAVDMVAVDGDYKSVGFDLNFGVGYKLLKKGDSYLGIALNSGVTMPNISAKNLTSKIDFTYNMMDKWDMDIKTYKIGPQIKAKLAISPLISLEGGFGYGFEKMYVSSDLFKSDIDTKGSYSIFDINLKYDSDGRFDISKNLYFKLGYSHKSWSVDAVDVNLFNFFKFDALRPFNIDLSTNYGYFSVGYNF